MIENILGHALHLSSATAHHECSEDLGDFTGGRLQRLIMLIGYGLVSHSMHNMHVPLCTMIKRPNPTRTNGTKLWPEREKACVTAG